MVKSLKTYTVNVFRYPERIKVSAHSVDEARQLAKNQVDYSVWKTSIEYCERAK